MSSSEDVGTLTDLGEGLMRYVDPDGNVTITDVPELIEEAQAPWRARRFRSRMWKLNLYIFLLITLSLTMFIDLVLLRLFLGVVLSPTETLQLLMFVSIVYLVLALPVWLKM